MELQWHEVFSRKLGHTAPEAESNANICNAKSYLYELLNTRNLFSHEAPNDEFTDEDVYRIADTASRLLRAVKKRDEATITEEIQEEFGRRLYSTEAEASQTEPVSDELVPDEAEVQFEAPESAAPGAQVDEEEPLRRVDLSGLNLSEMDLRGRNLHLANLKNADLSNSNLQYENLADMDLSDAKMVETDLFEANLANANLSHADLSGARLQWADLKNCNMTHAKLVNADLRMAAIDGADFSNADLTGADIMHNPEFYDLDNGRRVELETLLDAEGELLDYLIGPSHVNFSDAVLRRANMQRAWLEFNVTLTRADMTEANFFGSRLAANLAGAILSKANLSKCWILSSDFSGATMDGIDLSESECVYTKFANAQMSGAKLHNFIIDAHDDGTDDSWDNVNLSEADLSGAILTPHQSFRNANLTGAVFKDADLSGADLSHSDLMDTDFTGANLWCVKFTGAQFRYTTVLPDGDYWDEDTDMTRFTGPLEDC